MRALTLPWLGAFNLVCEVALGPYLAVLSTWMKGFNLYANDKLNISQVDVLNLKLNKAIFESMKDKSQYDIELLNTTRVIYHTHAPPHPQKKERKKEKSKGAKNCSQCKKSSARCNVVFPNDE